MRVALIAGTLLSLAAVISVAAEPPLVLAEDGAGSYAIVIGTDASEAEQYAAKELAHFLGEMTGAGFPVVTDATPAAAREIVLGNTSRGSLDDVPPALKPGVPEGFVILRRGEKLLILGNIPRATLYGVYDFLEQELGCRFLAGRNVNHIPRAETLRVTFASRKYDPPLEWRSLMMVPDGTWAVRARLNGYGQGGFIPMEKILGGGRVVGAEPWHTFQHLVPPSKYFDEHPEYFSMVNGTRVSTRPQLCLTNDDVFEISLEKLRQWLRADKGRPTYNPHTLRWVSVTQNDWRNWCECPNCKAIDDEEGGPTGSYVRFVNRIAEALEREFPGVAVHMFGYMYTRKPPLKTRPRHNVIVQFAGSGEVGLSHPKESNVNTLRELKAWGAMTSRLYIWDYITRFGTAAGYMDPLPNLMHHDETIRTFVKHGLKGYFGQGAQTIHAELRDLRMYLAAQCAWRPETDGPALVEEFCRLYYGPAAPYMLEYIAATHDPLWEGECLTGGIHYFEQNILNQDAYLDKIDAILEKAEQAADTPERKLRVANQRLGYWYRMVSNESGRIGNVMDLPIEWRFQTDPDDVGLKEEWWKLKKHDDWATIRIDDFWTRQGYEDYYGAAWYAVEFEYPEGAPADALQFYFGAIDGRCDIYLNGEKIAEQKERPMMMWDKPFFRPIPGGLTPGRHRLVVRVVKKNYAAGIWKQVSVVDMTDEVPERIRVAGQRLIDVSSELQMTHFSEYYGKPGEQFTRDIYPRIRTLINRNQFKPGAATVPGTVRTHFSSRGEAGWRRVVDDSGAETGRCMQQDTGTPYTMNSQSMDWNIKSQLTKAAETGKRYRLRARLKIRKTGDEGGAVRLGVQGYNQNWAGTEGQIRTIPAAELTNGIWTVYEYPEVIRPMLDSRYALAFVRPDTNPDNIDWVRLDWLELVPVKE